jgi:HPt (histidine-containing phosphotransfer) domain-containing protein
MVDSHAVPIDMAALASMLGGDKSLVDMILKTFRAEIKADIAALTELSYGNDPEPIRALAHRLKGTCSNAKAMPMSNAAKALQAAMAAGDMSATQQLISDLEACRNELEQYLSEQGA